MICFFFFCRIRLPPSATRTNTLCPDTPLIRASVGGRSLLGRPGARKGRSPAGDVDVSAAGAPRREAAPAAPEGFPGDAVRKPAPRRHGRPEIGRAHV